MLLKSVLPSAAVLLAGAAALTACQPGSTASVSGSAPAHRTAAPSAPAGTRSPAAPPAASPSAASASPSASTAPSPSRAASPPAGHAGSKGGDATSDAYAFKHPCSTGQLSVHVVRRPSAPTQRVIEVRNLGARSCGLSYYPRVVLDDGEAADGGVSVEPLVPDGLGGAPAYPVYAGRTAYAVIDLDPSGATHGTADGVDSMNVLADGDHMPSADTLIFPLGSGARVLAPKLGLYRDDVPDAVASMRSADILP